MEYFGATRGFSSRFRRYTEATRLSRVCSRGLEGCYNLYSLPPPRSLSLTSSRVGAVGLIIKIKMSPSSGGNVVVRPSYIPLIYTHTVAHELLRVPLSPGLILNEVTAQFLVYIASNEIAQLSIIRSKDVHIEN